MSWYWFSSSNCKCTMSEMESFTPKPVTSRAVHPAMPMTVMKNRFLYRNRFRAVTLWVNFIRFHRGVSRSRKMRLPALGALGSISRAGGLPQGGPAGAEGGQQSAHQRRRRGQQGQGPLDGG